MEQPVEGLTRRAAVDVGTNSVRLLVADLHPHGLEHVERLVEVTRLGEGLGTEGRLREKAKVRTGAVVERYVSRARELGAELVVIAGTSATREAQDGAEFVADLGLSLAVPAVVLSPESEALLAYRGATLELVGDIVLLDIGGGSTELVRRTSSGLLFDSLALGSVRAQELWVRHDPPLPEERAAIRREAKELLSGLRTRYGCGYPALTHVPRGAAVTSETGAPERGPQLVGVAGTVTSLACLVLGLTAYDAERLHLSELGFSELCTEVDRLAGMTAGEILALGCIQRGREGVLVAGGEILLAAMDALGYERLSVSERDLLEGLILEAETVRQQPQAGWLTGIEGC